MSGMLTVGAANSSSFFSTVPLTRTVKHLVAVVPTRFQVDRFVLPGFGDQSLQVRRSWSISVEWVVLSTTISAVSVRNRPDRDRRR